MIRTNWFAHCQTIDEVKAEYRRLCFVHHPDRGGDGTVMQSINTAYRLIVRGDMRPNDVSVPSRPRRTAGGGRSTWHRPPPATSSDPLPEYSREYVRQLWNNTPWERTATGAFYRIVGAHTVTLVQFPADAGGMWAVQVDDHFGKWAHQSRAQAETDAFNMLFERLQGG